MKSFTSALCLGVGAIIGIIIFAILEGQGVTHFDPSYTLGNLIQASATVLVGLVVAAYFQRYSQAERKEKDLLLRHLDLVVESLDKFDELKDGSEVAQIAAILKTLSRKCKAMHSLLVELKYNAHLCQSLNFDADVKELRRLATETPIRDLEGKAGGRMNSVVREGIMQLAAENRMLIESKVQQLKMRVFRGEIGINNP